MSIKKGDIVQKIAGHSDLNCIGLVISVTKNPNVTVLRVLTQNKLKNWYCEYVSRI